MAADDGAPEAHLDGAPLPVTISISHRVRTGASLIASHEVKLGCDLERVEPRSLRMMNDFYTPGELELVRLAEEGEERTRIAALIWSAKESLLKVLRAGLRRDTRSVELAKAGPPAPRGDWSRLLVRDLDAGIEHHGWWRPRGELLLTVVASPLCPEAPLELMPPDPKQEEQ